MLNRIGHVSRNEFPLAYIILNCLTSAESALLIMAHLNGATSRTRTFAINWNGKCKWSHHVNSFMEKLLLLMVIGSRIKSGI